MQDELVFYREEFPLLLEEFARLPHDLPLLVEGAALLPEFFVETQDIASPPPGLEPGRPTETQNFASLRVVHGCVVYLIPTRPFQLQHYAQRPWVLNILSQCNYPEEAFNNWMERDARFGEIVAAQAIERGIQVIWVDGKCSLEALIDQVDQLFFRK